MSNIIPPLLSSSPPPISGVLDEDDEFGDFAVATNLSYGCDSLSITSLKENTTGNQSISHDCPSVSELENSKIIDKDFQDKRKTNTVNSEAISSGSEAFINRNSNIENNLTYNNSKIKVESKNKYSNFQYFPEIPPDMTENDTIVPDDEVGVPAEFDEFQNFESSENVVHSKTFVISDDIDIVVSNFTTCIDLNCTESIKHVDEHCKIEDTDANATEINNCVEKLENILTEEDSTKIKHDSEHISNGDVLPADIALKHELSNQKESDCSTLDTEENQELNEIKEPEKALSEDDEFGDFTNHANGVTPPLQIHDECSNSKMTEHEIEWETDPFSSNKIEDIVSFGDFENQVFVDQISTVNESQFEQQREPINDGDDDDEFGDFNDYSAQEQTVSAEDNIEESIINIETIPQKAQEILLEMFPTIKQTAEDYQGEDITTRDLTFVALKDVTDTSALLYQWSKSSGQKCLLTALNIDTRNILYGPRWNESMPRYAATLGYTPLEPLKPLISDAQMVENSPQSSSQQPSLEPTPNLTEVPTAQFDWSGSGLTNPLENSPASTMLLDLEQLVASLDIQFSSTLTPKSQNSPSPVDDIDDWEFWLRLTPKKIVERPPSQLKESAIKISLQEEVDVKPDCEFPSVLQPEPTPLTQSNMDTVSVKSLQFNEIQESSEIGNFTEFDDFTSFKVSRTKNDESFTNYSGWSSNAIPLRETHISNAQNEIIKPKLDEPGWLKPTILTPDLPRKTNIEPKQDPDGFGDFQACTDKEESLFKADEVPNVNTPEVIADDKEEFSQFKSTLPIKPEPQHPLQPTLEILKPSILQPAISTSINWPDPGVTNDELDRLEMYYKPKASNSTTETPKLDALGVKGMSAKKVEVQKSGDDDDWSDFVSHPEPVCEVPPLYNKTSQLKQPSRTSTPELSLSVPHLNQIQPPRKPVPIITHQGLLQTKLPVESSSSQKSVQQNVHSQLRHQNGFQPSLISNQYVAHLGENLTYRNIDHSKPTNIRQTKQMNNHQPSSLASPQTKPEEFDDEWSDFVSSRPSISNGLNVNPQPKINFDWNRPPQFTSWSTNITPNIITNPASFDTFQNYASPVQTDLLKDRGNSRSNSNAAVQLNRSTGQSVNTLPDLDFIAPKNRTWNK